MRGLPAMKLDFPGVGAEPSTEARGLRSHTPSGAGRRGSRTRAREGRAGTPRPCRARAPRPFIVRTRLGPAGVPRAAARARRPRCRSSRSPRPRRGRRAPAATTGEIASDGGHRRVVVQRPPSVTWCPDGGPGEAHVADLAVAGQTAASMTSQRSAPGATVRPRERGVLGVELDAHDPRAGVALREVGHGQPDVRPEVPDQAAAALGHLGRGQVVAARRRCPRPCRRRRCSGAASTSRPAQRAQPHPHHPPAGARVGGCG